MKNILDSWKRVTSKIGHFQFIIIFSLLYLVTFVPLGKIVAISKDYLQLKSRYQWKNMEDNYTTIKKVRRQS